MSTKTALTVITESNCGRNEGESCRSHSGLNSGCICVPSYGSRAAENVQHAAPTEPVEPCTQPETEQSIAELKIKPASSVLLKLVSALGAGVPVMCDEDDRQASVCACNRVVTLPCSEREVSAPQELSGRCDRSALGIHHRCAKSAVRLGRGKMALRGHCHI
jgi:hypothetical protein